MKKKKKKQKFFLYLYYFRYKKNKRPIIYKINIKKIFIANIIENQDDINKLSRESLLKIINLIPTYYDKTIIELIDNVIKNYKNDQLIEISNIRLNDLKSEIFKKKYKISKDFIDFKIYEYENFNDIYFTGKEINPKKLLEKIKENIKYEEFEILHIFSRTIKTGHIFKINKSEKNYEELNDLIEKRLNRIKKIETIKMRFYFKEKEAPQIKK